MAESGVYNEDYDFNCAESRELYSSYHDDMGYFRELLDELKIRVKSADETEANVIAETAEELANKNWRQEVIAAILWMTTKHIADFDDIEESHIKLGRLEKKQFKALRRQARRV